MKFKLSTPARKPYEKPEYPYLARHKASNEIVIIGKFDIVVINDGLHSPGDGWPTDKHEHLFEPLKPGEVVTLENE